jgi:hypothetical protein
MLWGATHTALVNILHNDDRQPDPLPLSVRVTIGAYKMYLPIVLK